MKHLRVVTRGVNEKYSITNQTILFFKAFIIASDLE